MEGKELLARIAALKDNLQKYLETKASYYGIVAFEKAVKVLSLFMANALLMIVGFLALLFMSGAAAIYLGILLESYWLGMLLTGGFYLFLMLIFFVGRKRIFGRMAIRILLNVFFSDPESKAKH